MQLPIHGQWWSKRATHRSHTEQCFERTGRRTKQPEQNRADSKPLPPRSDSSTIVCKNSRQFCVLVNITPICLYRWLKSWCECSPSVVDLVLGEWCQDLHAMISKNCTTTDRWMRETVPMWMSIRYWRNKRTMSHRTIISMLNKYWAATEPSNDRRTLFCQLCVPQHTNSQA